MRENIFQNVIKISFFLLFILVPLILTPWNYELFEFNKMLAVYALTTVIVGTWVGRMILAKKIIFKKTPFDIPLVIFLVSQFLSFLVSIDRHTSFWGYYSRFHGGLLSTICYLLLYWAYVSNMDKRSTLFTIRYSLVTAALVATYGIAEHFGIDASIWVQDVKNRVFSTLGQPNWLAAWLAVLIPLTISFIFWRIGYVGLYCLFTLCFFYTKSQSGLLGLVFSLAIFWSLLFFLNLKQKFLDFKGFCFYFLIFNFLFLILFSSVGFSAYPELKSKLEKIGLLKKTQTVSPSPTYHAPALEVGGTASGEIRKIVWKGALEIFKHYPIFGTGVETFAYSYYNFRPIEHNLVSEWDFLYNKAHNEYLNFLATTGIFGLGSYLFLIFSFIFWFFKNLKSQMSNVKSTSQMLNPKDKKISDLSCGFEFCVLSLALLSGWLSILVTNFFGFSVVPVALFFFLIPAFCVILTKQEDKKQLTISNYQLPTRQKVSLAATTFAICYLLFAISKLWRADFHYARGDKFNKINQYSLAFPQLLKAIELNKSEPVYKNEIAETASYLALSFFQLDDATSAANFAKIALSQSEQALKTSPKNLNFWKTRVKILYNLTLINKEFFNPTIEALNQAISLAPTDPKLVYNLGVLLGNFGQKQKAIESFKKAIELKPNYKDPRYALALYLKDAGEIQQAKEQLEYILKYIDPKDSPSAELLKQIP